MAIEDVQKAIAEEQAAQESQKGTQSDTKQTQASEKNQSANEKRKKDALRKLQSLETLYDRYIGELASGKRKGETLSPGKLKEIEAAAVKLSDRIKDLNRIVNPPTPEREARVGELPASRVPFGGQQVGGATVSGPITSAVKYILLKLQQRHLLKHLQRLQAKPMQKLQQKLMMKLKPQRFVLLKKKS
jgi:hypothetical protein